MTKVQATPPKGAKPVAATEKTTETKSTKKEAAPTEPVMVKSRELAERLGVPSTTLRRYLRTLPQFQDGGYTRYAWAPNDPFLEQISEGFEKFKTDEKEKNAKRLASIKEKKAASSNGDEPRAKKKKEQPEPEVEEEEVEDEGEDEFEEIE